MIAILILNNPLIKRCWDL